MDYALLEVAAAPGDEARVEDVELCLPLDNAAELTRD